MESLLTGLGLVVIGFLIDLFINPTGVITSGIPRIVKWIGIILVVVGGIELISADDSDHKKDYASEIVNTENSYKECLEEEKEYEIVDTNVNIDGTFIWHRYKENGKIGALTGNKTILIPAKFDAIGFNDKDSKFLVSDSDYKGRYNIDGSEFINVDRLYNYIYFVELKDGRSYYEIAKIEKGDFKYGICDSRGREIIAPLYRPICYNSKYSRYYEIIEESDFESFYITMGEYDYRILYLYIDSQNEVRPMPSPIYYKVFEYSTTNYSSGLETDYHVNQIRMYDDKILFNFRAGPLLRIENGKRIYSYIFPDDDEDSDEYIIYKEGNNFIRENNTYKTVFSGARDFSLSECIKQNTVESTQGNPVDNENGIELGNDQFVPNNNFVPHIEVSNQNSLRGHYETRTEQCIDCLGRGYNEKIIWHGGDKTSTVQIRCSFCHGKGTITKREYVFDN